MGLAALRKILDPVPITPDALRGRTVAVDANNLIWQFVTAIAGTGQPLPTGPDGLPNAHLIGLVNRVRWYAELGIRSAWIFDGKQPALKSDTLAAREARVAAAGTVWVGDREMQNAAELLDALGIPQMVAPGESDPQCAHFVRTGQAWAAVTQDYDIALHGCPRAVRNLSLSKTKVPELLDLDASLARAELTREQLVDAAILIGTDYNVGIKGVGPAKAMKLVKQHGDLHAALAALGVAMPEADEVRALFLDHPVEKHAQLAWRAPDPGRVRDVLARGGLSSKRAEEVLRAVAGLHSEK